MRFAAFPLRDAVAVVTGGARGIGLAIVEELVCGGAVVAVTDIDGGAAFAVARRLGLAVPGRALDVTDLEEYQRVIAEIEDTVGPIDIVVNNAGIMPVGPLLGESRAVAEANMRVNFWAHYNSYQVLAPRMIGRGRGHFINVASAAGAIHSPGLATYAAATHAATGFARSAREELLGTGVTVSVVMPSAVRTQLVDGIPLAPWERRTLLHPDTVARAAVRTLRRRPAAVGSPRGLLLLLRLRYLVPEWLRLAVRRAFDADRPVDRVARGEHDDRIELVARAE